MFWKIIFQEKFIHSSDFLCSVFNMFKCINIVSIFGSWISFHFINVKPPSPDSLLIHQPLHLRLEIPSGRMNATQSCAIINCYL